jgi:hydroxybutyrate-dimer hydrolase
MQNPEANWGRDVLHSIELAFYVLNLTENFGEVVGDEVVATIVPANTIVIASSISNGATASLHAAEDDTTGLIDAVVVSEPNASPSRRDFTIRQGSRTWTDQGASLLEYYLVTNLYQYCASAVTPLGITPGRCQGLADRGLLTTATLDDQAAEAQEILNDYGFLPEQNGLAHLMQLLDVPLGVAVGYASAYGQFSVARSLCGYSYAAVDEDGRPRATTAEERATVFSDVNAIPPAGPYQLVNNGVSGGLLATYSTSDAYLDGALCLYDLMTSTDDAADRVRDGLERVLLEGDLHGKPSIIVHGRSDQIVAINHSSRSYLGLNSAEEGDESRLRYIEVTNAMHLDSLLSAGLGYDAQYVPLHYYFSQAMDLMYEHLTGGTDLPPSQVVATVPRGRVDGEVPPIDAGNLPAINSTPACPITVSADGMTVSVPDC